MTRSPVTIEDGYYFSLAEFNLYVVRLLGDNMELRFERRDDKKRGFVIELHNAVAVIHTGNYIDWILSRKRLSGSTITISM